MSADNKYVDEGVIIHLHSIHDNLDKTCQVEYYAAVDTESSLNIHGKTTVGGAGKLSVHCVITHCCRR